jgi:hypothetical protein
MFPPFKKSTKFKIYISVYVFIISVLFSNSRITAQEIKMELQSIDSLEIENNKVLDVNGELCSMILLSTELDSVKFYTNLGVEKITKTTSGYQIWIPGHASMLKLSIPGFPLYEYRLPHSSYTFSVYLISLKATQNRNYIIKDTLKPFVSFATEPTNAKIFLNGVFIGKSPKTITNPDFSTFQYAIRKRGFDEYTSLDTMNIRVKNINVQLTDLIRSRRYFFLFNLRWDEISFLDVNIHPMPGFTFGVFGKTGAYGSFNATDINQKFKDNVWPGGSMNPDFFKYTRSRKFCAITGITQQLGRSEFIYGGVGYINRTYRSDILNNTMKSSSMMMNVGVVIRVFWYALFQIDYTKNLNNPYSSFALGIGGNFPQKLKK